MSLLRKQGSRAKKLDSRFCGSDKMRFPQQVLAASVGFITGAGCLFLQAIGQAKPLCRDVSLAPSVRIPSVRVDNSVGPAGIPPTTSLGRILSCLTGAG